MTVYDFIVYFSEDDTPQHRHVVAKSEEEALEKLNNHFEKLHSEGFMKPMFITLPTVDLENVII